LSSEQGRRKWKKEKGKEVKEGEKKDFHRCKLRSKKRQWRTIEPTPLLMRSPPKERREREKEGENSIKKCAGRRWVGKNADIMVFGQHPISTWGSTYSELV